MIDTGETQRRMVRIPVRIFNDVELGLNLGLTRMASAFGRGRITRPGGPVVSLTTYGERAKTVHLTIESIARGQMLPSRLILWIDDKAIFDDLPPALRRLQNRGLEVMSCANFGPHKKYYPYLEMSEEIRHPLVTADDDLLYPRGWLRELDQALREFPDVVNCHRARRIVLNKEGLEAYENWGRVRSTEASFRNFATGVGGVIYPLRLQQALKSQAATFVESCPNADDVWLHLWALRTGYKVRQIRGNSFRLRYIPGTQGTGLCQRNVVQGENDLQIKTTYQRSDIDCLRDADRSLVPSSPRGGVKPMTPHRADFVR
jgi:hypothetical protein